MPRLGYKISQLLEGIFEWLEKGYIRAINVVIQKEYISDGNIINDFTNAPGNILETFNFNIGSEKQDSVTISPCSDCIDIPLSQQIRTILRNFNKHLEKTSSSFPVLGSSPKKQRSSFSFILEYTNIAPKSIHPEKFTQSDTSNPLQTRTHQSFGQPEHADRQMFQSPETFEVNNHKTHEIDNCGLQGTNFGTFTTSLHKINLCCSLSRNQNLLIFQKPLKNISSDQAKYSLEVDNSSETVSYPIIPAVNALKRSLSATNGQSEVISNLAKAKKNACNESEKCADASSLISQSKIDGKSGNYSYSRNLPSGRKAVKSPHKFTSYRKLKSNITCDSSEVPTVIALSSINSSSPIPDPCISPFPSIRLKSSKNDNTA